MAEARSRQLWDHTAEVMSLIANVLLGKKGRWLSSKKFHPFHQAQERLPGDSKLGFALLKKAFKGEPIEVPDELE